MEVDANPISSQKGKGRAATPHPEEEAQDSAPKDGGESEEDQLEKPTTPTLSLSSRRTFVRTFAPLPQAIPYKKKPSLDSNLWIKVKPSPSKVSASSGPSTRASEKVKFLFHLRLI
jgi:hypothetical protein